MYFGRLKLGRHQVELDEIYLAEGLRHIAHSLVTIFVPIYLYQLGYPIRHVLAFYLAVALIKLCLLRWVGRLTLHVGVKRLLAVSYVASLVNLLALSALSTAGLPLVVVIATWSISMCLYWVSFHTNFSRVTNEKTSGHEIGLLDVYMRLAGVAGPTIGAAIAVVFGVSNIFLVAALIMLLAVVPLLATRDTVREKHVDYRRLKVRHIWRDWLASMGYSANGHVTATIWPLYLGLTLVTYQKIGFIYSLASALCILVIYVVGRRTDRGEGTQLIRWGVVLSVIVDLVRGFGGPFFFALFATVSDLVSTAFINTPWMATFYRKADHHPRIEYIVYMLEASEVVHALVMGSLVGLSFFLPDRTVLVAGFILAAGFVSMTGLIVGRARS